MAMLAESQTETSWVTDRDKALKPGLSLLKRDVWYAYIYENCCTSQVYRIYARSVKRDPSTH